MECSEPGTFRDEDLLAYLDGASLLPMVAEHITRCPRCFQQVAYYQRLEQQLTGKLYRWDCPSSQALGEYHLGLLMNDEGMRVKLHLSTCVLCAAELATLSTFLEHDPLLAGQAAIVQETGALPVASQNHRDVSTSAGQRLRDQLDLLQEQALSGARQIIATLLPPSPQLALRREVVVQSSSWPRRYTAEDVQISLQLERDSHLHALAPLQLLGLVTRTGSPLATFQGAQVLLRERRADSDPAHPAPYTQEIDELGNFLFSMLTPAAYTLELHIPQGVVIIDPLILPVQE